MATEFMSALQGMTDDMMVDLMVTMNGSIWGAIDPVQEAADRERYMADIWRRRLIIRNFMPTFVFFPRVEAWQQRGQRTRRRLVDALDVLVNGREGIDW